MKDLFGSFFKDKKIFITGHTGFIGSWLSIWLNELESEVIGYSLPPYTKKDNFVVTKLKKEIIHTIGDIRDFHKLSKVLNKYNPEIILHLAAQPLVRKSYNLPKITYETNVIGTVNAFEAFRKNSNAKILINFTTDKCYENKGEFCRYKEEDRIGGYDPYSSSKACSELVTAAYIDSFFKTKNKKDIKYASSIRSGNVIGGGDWQEDRLIPDIIKAILNDREVIIRNPEHIRPWQYVLEPIRGILLLIGKLSKNGSSYIGPWNFGPSKDSVYSVQQVIDTIIKFYPQKSVKYKISEKDDNLHESKLLLLDSEKSNKLLRWKPLLNFDQTIRFTCDWYFQKEVDYDFDVQQIKNYLSHQKKT